MQLKQVEEADRRDAEHERDEDREPGQIPLDDVLPALRRRREAEPTEARIAPGVHEHENDEEDREQNVDDRDDLEHVVRIACGREGAWLATPRRFAPQELAAWATDLEPASRARVLDLQRRVVDGEALA